MLSQLDADLLIEEEKEFIDSNSIAVSLGTYCKIQRALKSKNSQNEFLLNIDSSRIEVSKVKYQTRCKSTNQVLLRIDTNGPRHQNPDGEFIECPHIHIYREGYGDKWAYPLDSSIFTDVSNHAQLLKDFLVYFNVDNIPGLFFSHNFL